MSLPGFTDSVSLGIPSLIRRRSRRLEKLQFPQHFSRFSAEFSTGANFLVDGYPKPRLSGGEPRPPQEQLAKKLGEQVDFRERERFEETLDRMRGKQIFRLRFRDARVPGVFFQGVEVAQVPACAVEQEDEDLLENLNNGKPFATFSQLQRGMPGEIFVRRISRHRVSLKLAVVFNSERRRWSIELVDLPPYLAETSAASTSSSKQ